MPPRSNASPEAAASVPAWLPAIVAAILCPAYLVKVKDYDVWWHMATGRWIAAHHALPATDPFTYTMNGRPWHLVNGIAEVVLYEAYRLGGADALVWLKAVFAFLTLTLTGLALREVGAKRGTVIALVFATALLLHGRNTVERPMIMGAALLAGAQLALLRSHERRDRSHFFFLAALPLWPLVHGNALLGLVQLGALFAAAVIARAPRRHLISVGGTLAACLVLTAVLPWWRSLYSIAAGLGGGATATTFTAEWRSGAAAIGDRVGHWAVIAGALVAGVLLLRKNASLLLLTLLGAAISAKFARNAYDATLLAMPAFACALEMVASALRKGRAQLLPGAAPPVLALAVCAVQFALAPLRTVGGPFGFGVDPRPFPIDTLVTLRRLPVHRLFNGFPIGGYLIWEDGPWGVYCDGRTVSLYEEEDVKRLFLPMLESAEALTAAADHWDAVYGLNENLSHPNQWMMVSAEWVPLHIGLGTSLFIRSTHLNELPPGVKPLALVRFTEDRRWIDGWYAGILKDPALREQLAGEFTEAARLGPSSPMLVDIVRVVASLDPTYAGELEAALVKARAASGG